MCMNFVDLSPEKKTFRREKKKKEKYFVKNINEF